MFQSDLQLKSAGLLYVRLEGDFTASPQVAAFKDRILETCAGDLRFFVVLDMERVPMIDSRGIGLLMAIRSHCAKAGGRIFLSAPQPYVAEALRVTNIDRTVTVCDSRDEALGLARRLRAAASGDPASAPSFAAA